MRILNHSIQLSARISTGCRLLNRELNYYLYKLYLNSTFYAINCAPTFFRFTVKLRRGATCQAHQVPHSYRRLFAISAFTLTLMFVRFFNGVQAALHFATLLKQISVAEIRTRRNFMGVRRIQQFESLGEQFIGSCIVLGLVTQLGKRNKRLALSLRISACTSKSEGFLGFFLRFL